MNPTFLGDWTRPALIQPRPDHAKKVFEGVLHNVYHWEQELYDGSQAIFEQLSRKDCVVIYPILNDGRILLTKQEQPGRKPFVATIGGGVESGETVQDAAARELQEESGYAAREFELIEVAQPSSKIDWMVCTCVARGLVTFDGPNPDGGERIELMPVEFDQLLREIIKPEFADPELGRYVYEALLDTERLTELRTAFRSETEGDSTA